MQDLVPSASLSIVTIAWTRVTINQSLAETCQVSGKRFRQVPCAWWREFPFRVVNTFHPFDAAHIVPTCFREGKPCAFDVLLETLFGKSIFHGLRVAADIHDNGDVIGDEFVQERVNGQAFVADGGYGELGAQKISVGSSTILVVYGRGDRHVCIENTQPGDYLAILIMENKPHLNQWLTLHHHPSAMRIQILQT